jgi:hypothetical protein
VVIVQHEHCTLGRIRDFIEQQRHQIRGCRHLETAKQRDRCSADSGLDGLQGRHQVIQKAHRIVVAFVEREPCDPVPVCHLPQPTRHESCLAEARRRRNERERSSQSVPEPLEQARSHDRTGPQRRDVDLRLE